MVSLPRNILVLVLWVTFFFNIERLVSSRSDLVNISAPVYILVACLLVLGLLLPHWRAVSTTAMYVIASASFVGIKLTDPHSNWSNTYIYWTLLEYTGVLVTAGLARKVGLQTADWGKTLQAVLRTGLDGRVHPREQAEEIIRREMQAARRRNQPLSILLIEADTQGARIELSAAAQQLRRQITQRLGLWSLTQLLAQSLRSSDALIDDTDQGRWLLMTSEGHQPDAAAILHRLNEQTKRQFGIKLKYGMATFPEQGLTLKELVSRASEDLRSVPTERAGDDGIVPTPIPSEESIVPYPSLEPAADFAVTVIAKNQMNHDGSAGAQL